MKQSTIEKLQNLAVSMQLVTVEDMQKHSIPQLVTMIANKMNELIQEVYRFEGDVSDVVKTQNDNIQYLLGEGLHLEVATVFEGWMEDGTFDTLINQSALKKVNDRIDETNAQLSDIAINVIDFGAVGDGVTDDTEAINNCFIFASKNGKKVTFKPKKYAVTKLVIPSNITIDFTGATIIRLPTNLRSYQVLDLVDVENVVLLNPIVIGDRDSHIISDPDNLGEWGHGINLLGVNNVTITNPTISKCWGDGIYFGKSTNNNLCRNVKITGTAHVSKCRRQGVSVVCGIDCSIETLIAIDIEGTAPGCCIDFEPNNSDELINNFNVNNISAIRCAGGLSVVVRSQTVDLTINNVELINCDAGINIVGREFGESVNGQLNKSININNIYINKILDRPAILIKDYLCKLHPTIYLGNVVVDEFVINTQTSARMLSVISHISVDYTPINRVFGNLITRNLVVNKIISDVKVKPFYYYNALKEDTSLRNVKINSVNIYDNDKLSIVYYNTNDVEDCYVADPNKLKLVDGENADLINGFNLVDASTISLRSNVTSAVIYSKIRLLKMNFVGAVSYKEIILNGYSLGRLSSYTLQNALNKIICIRNTGQTIYIDTSIDASIIRLNKVESLTDEAIDASKKEIKVVNYAIDKQNAGTALITRSDTDYSFAIMFNELGPDLTVQKFNTSTGEISEMLTMYSSRTIPSGSTLNRPTNVRTGAMYFDTSLAKPIWYKSDGKWVDATGTVV